MPTLKPHLSNQNKNMDPVNTLKGYSKINHLEDQKTPTNNRRKPLLIAITISIILLVTLTIALTFNTPFNNTDPQSHCLSLSPTESIKLVCNVTRYPNSCFTSMSSSLNTLSKPDPESIFKLSLQVSITELSNLSTMIWNKELSSNGGPALKDCESQIEDALSRLNDSVAEIWVGLTETKIRNVQTWISAAMSDEESCVDGLEEMESRVIDEVKGKMQKSREYVSNSLAILVNIRSLLAKFN